MRTSPRRLALVVLITAGLAACGSDDGDTAATTTSAAPTTTLATTTTAATTTAAAPATAASATTTTTTTAATTTTTVPAGPHVVTHAMGETEVPGVVERVVVLDSSFLDAAIALGVTPIGATEGLAGAGLPAYLGDPAASIELVGQTTTPNLEQIAALQPDLILGAKVRHEALYDQLAKIAPTVFSESSGTNWQEQVRLTGAALNRTPQAEGLLGQFEARAKSAGEKVGAPGKTAVVIRFIPGQIRLYGPATFSGSVLGAVGFDLGDKGYDPSFGMAVISPEQIDLIDADVIFATNPDSESGGAIASDRGAVEGLWATLPAVQAGRQFDVLDSTWMTGIGVLGANQILDDLEAKLG